MPGAPTHHALPDSSTRVYWDPAARQAPVTHHHAKACKVTIAGQAHSSLATHLLLPKATGLLVRKYNSQIETPCHVIWLSC